MILTIWSSAIRRSVATNRPSAACLFLSVCALIAAGCGGSGTGGSLGAQVFASNGCGSCHALKAAGSSGTVGPNLDALKPTVAEVEQQVMNGGGAMPSFEDKITAAELVAVARYVADSARGR
jgi:cytochrome c6